MHDLGLDDGRELEHLVPLGEPVIARPVPSRSGRPPTAEVLLVTVAMTALLLVGVEPDRSCSGAALSVRSWAVVGIEERRPVVVTVVDVPSTARIVRLAADGHQDTASVHDGHAVVAVRLSPARLSDAGPADVTGVRVVARDARGWTVARAPISARC